MLHLRLSRQQWAYGLPLLAGILAPLGFAPFHRPGFSILSLMLLFMQWYRVSATNIDSIKQSFWIGFSFGLGLFGFGVSWVYVSIHNYGHLNPLFAAFITFLFVAYLSLYPAVVGALYQTLSMQRSSQLLHSLLFSALWCLSEYLRATLFSGFPWLLLGVGQIDTPLRSMFPVLGVFGIGFLTCFAASSLVFGFISQHQKQRMLWIIVSIAIIVAPTALTHHSWGLIDKTPISVSVIQANLSMRDKWDEGLFWQLLQRYETRIQALIHNTDLIVMPESAIPVPSNYVNDFLNILHQAALDTKTAIVLGIPEPTSSDDTAYYNTLTTLGVAEGTYRKQHLVPFGEFIPKPFQALSNWLGLPSANMRPGKEQQPLVRVHNRPMASLICYEVAYPERLRQQLPEAEWITSISDDGWFGHSLAAYQQLQLSEVLSLQTNRFQIVANNDGLSSVINANGVIDASLPAFKSGVLKARIYPSKSKTPWVSFGDRPILIASALIVLLTALMMLPIKRRTSWAPTLN